MKENKEKPLFRKISIEGLEPFARGGTGECYFLDEETLLKLYYDFIPAEYVMREKEGAKAALIAGVPTAISFEMVEAGGRKGLIYETLHAKTIAQCVKEDASCIPELAAQYADAAKQLHTAEPRSLDFQPATAQIRRALPAVSEYAGPERIRRIEALLGELDEYTSYVHGDFHPNNVLVMDGELFLIDMGDFSIGCPLFDLATTYFSFFRSPEAVRSDLNAFTGMNRSQHREFWDAFMAGYFGGPEKAAVPGPDSQLFSDVVLLKEMWFEGMFGKYCTDDYRKNIRERVTARFAQDS